MKKLLLSIFTVICTGSVFSQEPLMVLTERVSDDELEYEKYIYNSDFLMKEKQVLYSDGVEAKEIFHFDEENQVVKLDGHQILNGEWKHTYYVDYLYDANGNKISRINYNSFGGPTFEEGGIYEYQYENNRRIGWSLTMANELVEQGELLYDGNGRLIEEAAQNSWGGEPMENAWRIVYSYENDVLDMTQQYYWSGSSWIIASTDKFYYDSNDNCIRWDHLSDNTVTNRFEYEYNTEYHRDELVLPNSPEDEIEPFRWVQYNNQLVLSHWYTIDDNNELIYICDFLYNYTPYDVMGMTDNTFAHSSFMVYPNPAAEKITIMSDRIPIKNLFVTDMSGKTVIKKMSVNKSKMELDVSHLPPGNYLVQGVTSKGTSTKKIIVR